MRLLACRRCGGRFHRRVQVRGGRGGLDGRIERRPIERRASRADQPRLATDQTQGQTPDGRSDGNGGRSARTSDVPAIHCGLINAGRHHDTSRLKGVGPGGGLRFHGDGPGRDRHAVMRRTRPAAFTRHAAVAGEPAATFGVGRGAQGLFRGLGQTSIGLAVVAVHVVAPRSEHQDWAGHLGSPPWLSAVRMRASGAMWKRLCLAVKPPTNGRPAGPAPNILGLGRRCPPFSSTVASTVLETLAQFCSEYVKLKTAERQGLFPTH